MATALAAAAPQRLRSPTRGGPVAGSCRVWSSRRLRSPTGRRSSGSGSPSSSRSSYTGGGTGSGERRPPTLRVALLARVGLWLPAISYFFTGWYWALTGRDLSTAWLLLPLCGPDNRAGLIVPAIAATALFAAGNPDVDFPPPTLARRRWRMARPLGPRTRVHGTNCPGDLLNPPPVLSCPPFPSNRDLAWTGRAGPCCSQGLQPVRGFAPGSSWDTFSACFGGRGTPSSFVRFVPVRRLT